MSKPHTSVSHHQSLEVETLNLNFTPKQNKGHKSKPGSDRNNIQPISGNNTPKTDRAFLLEKKKNYSESIRERNMNTLKPKKKQNFVIDLREDLEERSGK